MPVDTLNSDENKLIDVSIEDKNDILEWLTNNRKITLSFIVGVLFLSVSIIFSLYHLYAGYFGQPEAHLYRSIHVTMVLVMVFLIHPLDNKKWNAPLRLTRIIDLMLILLAIATELYYLIDMEGFAFRTPSPNSLDQIVGLIVCLLVFEATRRSVGWPLVLVASAFFLHALYADHLFSFLYGSPTFFDSFISETYMAEERV